MIDLAYLRRNFPRIRPEWLAQAREPVLEPDLPIIDAHHHLWAHQEGTYLAPALEADLHSGHDVRATIYVDCHSGYRTNGSEALRPVGETEFVISEAPFDPASGVKPCAAIVGWADLELGDAVQEVLEAHVAAGQGRFRGIRTRAAWHEAREVHPDGMGRRGLLLEPLLQQGVRRLGTMGLTLDVWVYHTQLSEVGALARACPGTTIVMNHCGGPLGIGPYEGRREDVFRGWREQIQLVARHHNVVVKLGGLGMPRTGWRFHERSVPAGSTELARHWAPYFETCVEAFGTKRSMVESNFPVDKGACSYVVLWNAFKRLAAGCNASEKIDLFSETAARVYRLQH